MRVLNVGSGPKGSGRCSSLFPSDKWTELRLDIDAAVQPDIVGSAVDMRSLLPDQSVDVIFCSHSLEHLYAFEVPEALQEFSRVLSATGFALITCPDIGAVAAYLLRNDVDSTAYVSPAGPISALDMLFGHGVSIRAGRTHMAHHTGFTRQSLGILGIAAGFSEVWVTNGASFDLWAVFLKQEAGHDYVLKQIQDTDIGAYFQEMAEKPPG